MSSTVKKWLQKNQIYDRDLQNLLPEYGINDPEKDLAKLKAKQWSEIQAKLKRQHNSPSNNSAALDKKIMKFTKLWKAARGSRKSTKQKRNRSRTSSRSRDPAPSPQDDAANAMRSPPIPSQRSPDSPLSPDSSLFSPNSDETPEPTRQSSWEDHTEQLRFSDEDSDELLEQNGFTLPPMMHHESVVEMLLTADDDIRSPDMTALSSPDDMQREESKYDYSDDVHQSPIVSRHHASAIGMRLSAFIFFKFLRNPIEK